jgi:hypothetical protein
LTPRPVIRITEIEPLGWVNTITIQDNLRPAPDHHININTSQQHQVGLTAMAVAHRMVDGQEELKLLLRSLETSWIGI